jgi:hypothetical protein
MRDRIPGGQVWMRIDTLGRRGRGRFDSNTCTLYETVALCCLLILRDPNSICSAGLFERIPHSNQSLEGETWDWSLRFTLRR